MSEHGWRAGWRVARFYPTRYLSGGTLWALVAALPLVPGALLKVAFDRASDGAPAQDSALSFLALLAVAEVTRSATLFSSNALWTRWWATVATWMRGNLLRAVLLGSGPPSERLPGTPGEAIGRFRDDVDDIIWLADGWVDLAGATVMAVVGAGVMLTIDPLLTLMVVLPLTSVIFITRVLGNRVRRLHRGLRQAGATVTAFVADMFTNAQTLKTSGAEQRAIERFRTLNHTRGGAAVRAQVTMQAVYNLGSVGAATISTGLVLLVAASRMRRGDFSVGDLALFTSYATAMTFFPRRIGESIARARAADVSTDRLMRFVPEDGFEGVFAPHPVDLTKPAHLGPTPSSPHGALRHLSIRGLTASPATGRRGIVDVDLAISAGEFVVVTGVVGAGKTTLLRALLGLVPIEAGTIEWNGAPVQEPGVELAPPRVAYVAQVPRLFSAALQENITLGIDADDRALHDAIAQACLVDDVAEMTDGLDTLVGPRGMRLSGGQAQRTAAARALVRGADLLIVDDLSSALDPQTEARLWDAVAALPTACLAVSHRPAVLARADRVITLADGRVTTQT